jgi:FMN phosphatase YigB (HAD superfamily)
VPGSDGCADAEDVVFFDLDDTLIDVNRRARTRRTRRALLNHEGRPLVFTHC